MARRSCALPFRALAVIEGSAETPNPPRDLRKQLEAVTGRTGVTGLCTLPTIILNTLPDMHLCFSDYAPMRSAFAVTVTDGVR